MLPVVVSFFPIHVQSVIDLFVKQLNNALNLHYVYHQNTGVIRAIFHKCP